MSNQPSPAAIASMLLTAPAWARAGLAHKPISERAAMELATRIATNLDQPEPDDPRQMALPLVGARS